MVLSLAFILAFIGAAVALLIGVIIFADVTEAMAATLPVSSGAQVPITNPILGDRFDWGDTNINRDFGVNDNSDFSTGSQATAGGMYITWDAQEVDTSRILNFIKITGGNNTHTTPVAIDTAPSGDFFQDQHIFVNGQTIDVLVVVENGTTHDLISYRSTNDGATWSSGTVAVTNVTSADPFWADVDGDNMVMFYRHNDPPTSVPLNVTTSSDGGSTWSTPFDVRQSSNQYFIDHLVVEQSPDGSTIHTTFMNASATLLDVLYSRSTDSGSTFSTPTVISGATGGSTHANQPRIFIDGSDVTVTSIATATTPHKFTVMRSTDNGASFLAQQDIYDETDCDWNRTFADSRTTLQVGRTLYVACVGIGLDDLLVGKSTDMGATWSSLASITGNNPDGVSTGIAAGREVEMHGEGNNIYVYFEKVDDAGASPTGHDQQALHRSTDGGSTWEAEELITSDTCCPVDGLVDDVQLKAFGGKAWLVFTRNVDDLGQYFFTLSTETAGLTPAEQQQVDTFNNALNIGFTVIGIVPVALFFFLFAIFGGRLN